MHRGQGEYPPDCDARRVFVTGFTGSAGTAVVTSDAALLWTDGRYFLQAESQLESGWTLMKHGTPGCPEVRRPPACLPDASLLAGSGTSMPSRGWRVVHCAPCHHPLPPLLPTS